MSSTIHHAVQFKPYEVRLVCERGWTPTTGVETILRDVLRTEDSRYYTVDERLVTCAECRIEHAGDSELYPPQTLHVARAAIRLDGKIYSVPRPGRHNHVRDFMIALIGEEKWHPSMMRERGFLLSDGSFVGRESAWRVAVAAGQLLERAPTDFAGGVLFSEDVW